MVKYFYAQFILIIKHYIIIFFCCRIPADLLNNDNNSVDDVKLNVENEADSDITTKLTINNSNISDSEKPSNNLETDEV